MSKQRQRKKKRKQYRDSGRDRRGKGPGMGLPKTNCKNLDPTELGIASLSRQHTQQLEASGLGVEIIEQAKLYSADDERIAEILNWDEPQSWDGGLVIPYLDVDGEDTGYSRVRPNTPRRCDGKRVRYESPREKTNKAYFPPGFDKNASEWLITEGEKKALAAMQAGFSCIGLSGIWSWAKKQEEDTEKNSDDSKLRKLIPDLEELGWTNRIVHIVFDSDTADKPVIQHAECELAKLLKSKGADVRIARLPGNPEVKVGLDDFLLEYGADGPTQLRKILQRARKPRRWHKDDYHKPPYQDLATDFLDSRFMHPDGPKLQYWKGMFWKWVGTHYVVLPPDQLKAAVGNWLVLRGLNQTTNRTKEVIESIKSKVIIDDCVEEPAWLEGMSGNQGDAIIAVRNGLLSLEELLKDDRAIARPHTPRWFSTSVLPYEYDPEAHCPRWEAFVEEVFAGDAGQIRLLQEILGYLITDDTSRHAIFMFVGYTRSGKGTTIRVIEGLVGKENCAAFTMAMICDDFAKSLFLGKKVATCPDAETPKNSSKSLELLKQISGEDTIPINIKNKPWISARLKTRIVISANGFPQFDDRMNALAARLQILSFSVSFLETMDRELDEKLEAELPGIFNWALEGLKRLTKNDGFTKSAESMKQLKEFKRRNSPVDTFVEERCELRADASVPTATFRDEFKTWCVDNDIPVTTDSECGRHLKSLGIAKTRPRTGDGRTWLYVGISLTGQSSRSGGLGMDSKSSGLDGGKEANDV